MFGGSLWRQDAKSRAIRSAGKGEYLILAITAALHTILVDKRERSASRWHLVVDAG